MMPLQVTYELVRPRLRVGDLIAFGGEGFVSDMIKWCTRSQISHVASVLEIEEGSQRRIKLIESTSLNGKSGVQINYASERISAYEGRIWPFFLREEVRERADWAAYTQFHLDQVGKPYDSELIAHLLFDRLNIVPAREDWTEFICSEENSAGYKLARILPANIDTSEVTPQGLVEFNIWSMYCQIKGSPKAIRSVNTKRVR